MKKKLYRSSTKGQSIPLIAVMLAVLFGLVALSLDVGNTYAEQREVVRATNAAAIEGMNRIIDNDGRAGVANQIVVSLNSNGIPVSLEGAEGDQMVWDAWLLDAAGNQIPGCANLRTCDENVFEAQKKNITYIKVDVQGKVDTYFARLFGQNTLPVDAIAHATRGTCVSGVYPIAVDASLLDMNTLRFDPPDTIYSDELYRNRTQKRIFLREGESLAGNFGFLRWTSDPGANSAQYLAEMLTGAGTLSQGFEEADWPENSPIAETTGYPQLPTKMSPGDWIHGNEGYMNSNAVNDQFDLHISNRTIVTLPIYDYAIGTGHNAAYHLVDLGRFYIRDKGRINPNSPESAEYGGKAGPYIDLVYLGRGGECASLASGGTTPLMSLQGNVSLYPHYKVETDTADLPVQFMVVLDNSGSMTWNFDGQGTVGGSTVICQGPGAIQCPPASEWDNPAERRMTIAENVLKDFAESVRPDDQVRIVTFSGTYGAYELEKNNPPSNEEALNAFSQVYPGNWTSDKPTILAAIDQATANPSGETASAIGLARALQVYENSPSTDPDTGKTFKRAVIFITDGVANVTRNGLLNVTPEDSPTVPKCLAEDLSCQAGDDLDENTPRPINAMNAEAFALSDKISPEEAGSGGIYVIALGPEFLTSGLVNVSSNLYNASDADALERLLAAIRDDVVGRECVDGVVKSSPATTITSNGLPDYSDSRIAPFGLQAPEVGIVTLTASGGQSYSGKILWDAATGSMNYRIDNIPPGSYTMTYWMAHKGPDGVTLVYKYAVPNNGLPIDSQGITLQSGADNLGTQILPIVLDIEPGYNVCAPPA